MTCLCMNALIEGNGSFEGSVFVLEIMILVVTPTAKKLQKLQDGVFGVKRSKERGDIGDILHIFVGDTM